jgi:hypothetical protein
VRGVVDRGVGSVEFGVEVDGWDVGDEGIETDGVRI